MGKPESHSDVPFLPGVIVEHTFTRRTRWALLRLLTCRGCDGLGIGLGEGKHPLYTHGCQLQIVIAIGPAKSPTVSNRSHFVMRPFFFHFS